MSVDLIITVSAKVTEQANRTAEALGWGACNFTIKTARIEAPSTHTHTGLAVRADESTAAIFVAATGGPVPEDLSPEALAAAVGAVDPADLGAILPSIQITAIPMKQSAGRVADYDAHCAAHGLVRLVEVVKF